MNIKEIRNYLIFTCAPRGILAINQIISEASQFCLREATFSFQNKKCFKKINEQF